MMKALALILLLLGPRFAGAAEAPRAPLPDVPSPRPSILTGTLEHPRYTLLFTDRAAAAAPPLLKRLEKTRVAFARLLGREWPGKIEVRLGMGRSEFEALALPGGAPPPWAVALAYPSRQIVLFEAGSLLAEDGAQTLLHEVTHAALGSIGSDWPRWFQEGLAMELSGERFALGRYQRLVRANVQERLFHFEDLAQSWPEHLSEVEVAYAQSYSFVGFLSQQHGSAKLAAVLDRVARGERFDDAFVRALGASLRYEEDRWRQSLPGRYAWVLMIDSITTWLGIAALLCVIGFVRRRFVLARRLREFEEEEAAEAAAEAELRELEAALGRENSVPADGEPAANDAPDADPDSDPDDKPLLH